MTRFYEKSEISFAIFWIILYVISFSVADNVSMNLGLEKSVTAVLGILLTAVVVIWIKNNGFCRKYGLCKPEIPAKKLFYYVPLILMASVNLWFGVTMNLSPVETLFYIISMFSVGFLEEIIFRGFLFKAMCEDNVSTAIIVSSITFGIGHIVNLFNGSGADLFSNLLQVGYAIAAGYLFTVIFYKTKSLWPCIITHGVLNALSVFADKGAKTTTHQILTALFLALVSIGYGIYIHIKHD